jgi:hypothetical protein
MRSMLRGAGVMLVLVLATTGCSDRSPTASNPAPPAGSPAPTGTTPPATSGSPAPVAINPAFAERALAIARTYVSWGRVDDELRWAPALCRLPLPGVARMSSSENVATHGRKLYSLFALHRDGYPRGPHAGQAIVKEAWTAEVVNQKFDPASARNFGDAGDHFYPYAQQDGVVYHAGARAGLYLMFKIDPAAPADAGFDRTQSDEGWVYATLTTAGEVTAAGRVQSCMDCHNHAAHERLFGLPAGP